MGADAKHIPVGANVIDFSPFLLLEIGARFSFNDLLALNSETSKSGDIEVST